MSFCALINALMPLSLTGLGMFFEDSMLATLALAVLGASFPELKTTIIVFQFTIVSRSNLPLDMSTLLI